MHEAPKFSQVANAYEPIEVAVSGISIEIKPKQWANIPSGIILRFAGIAVKLVQY